MASNTIAEPMNAIPAKRFGIPDAALPYLDIFFTPDELAFIAHAPLEPFTRSQVIDALRVAGVSNKNDLGSFLSRAYRRGVVNLADSSNPDPTSPQARFTLGDFYGRLDIFVITEQKAWQTIPQNARRALDAWYFDAYMDGLDPDPTIPPTQDRVLSLDEALAFIDAQTRPVYLNTCDCRSLSGDCGLPTRTCLTYKNGPNTFCGRGLSQAITKEEAKDVVRMADKAGLMHTANPNGICNCCGDCCYLFRGQQRRNSRGVWPIAPHIIKLDANACIGCGKCAKRCHFGVFAIERDSATGKRRAVADTSACVGCGICATTCPTHALILTDRKQPCPQP